MSFDQLGKLWSLTLLTCVLAQTPAIAQGTINCVDEWVTLRVRTEVVTILSGLRKMCQTQNWLEIVENDGRVVVRWVWGYTYGVCVQQ